jgi:hypothetical protein
VLVHLADILAARANLALALGAEARSPEASVLQQALGAFMARGTG